MRRAAIVALVITATFVFVSAGFVGLRQRPVAAASTFAEPVELVSEGGVLRAMLTAARQESEVAGQRFAATVYNAALVGPTLRVLPGDRIELTLVNDLDEPTNLHFHGLHVSPSGEL